MFVTDKGWVCAAHYYSIHKCLIKHIIICLQGTHLKGIMWASAIDIHQIMRKDTISTTAKHPDRSQKIACSIARDMWSLILPRGPTPTLIVLLYKSLRFCKFIKNSPWLMCANKPQTHGASYVWHKFILSLALCHWCHKFVWTYGESPSCWCSMSSTNVQL